MIHKFFGQPRVPLQRVQWVVSECNDNMQILASIRNITCNIIFQTNRFVHTFWLMDHHGLGWATLPLSSTYNVIHWVTHHFAFHKALLLINDVACCIPDDKVSKGWHQHQLDVNPQKCHKNVSWTSIWIFWYLEYPSPCLLIWFNFNHSMNK